MRCMRYNSKAQGAKSLQIKVLVIMRERGLSGMVKAYFGGSQTQQGKRKKDQLKGPIK